MIFGKRVSIVEETLRSELAGERKRYDELAADYRASIERGAGLRGENIALASSVAQLQEQMARERKLYDDLLALVVEMRREGFNPPDNPMQYVRTEDAALPSNVADVIRDIAGPDAALASALRQQASSMLADDVEADDVAKALRTGSTWNPLL